MAKTFELNSHSYEGRYLQLSCTQTQNVANNKSQIHWRLTVLGGTSNYYTTGPTTVVINGVRVYYAAEASWSTYRFPAGKSGSFVEGDLEVNHNVDGTKSVSCSLSTAIYTGKIQTRSDTWELESNPRYAMLETVADFTDEDNPSVAFDNYGGGKYSLVATIGTEENLSLITRTVAADADAYTFELTEEEREILRNLAPNSNSLPVIFSICSMEGNTRLWVSSQNANMQIVNAAPLLQSTVMDINRDTQAVTGGENVLVRFFSCARATVNAKARKGASIVNQSVEHGGVLYNGEGCEISNVESGEFLFSATDSRGNTTTQQVSLPIVLYTKLTCNIGNETPSAAGTLRITAEGDWFGGYFGETYNAIYLKCRYCVSGQSFGSWIDMDLDITDEHYTAVVDLTGLDYQSTYIFEVKAEDLLDTVFSQQRSIRVLPGFDWGKEDFNFNIPVTIQGKAASTLTLEDVYPVGSVYVSLGGVSPETLFGGIWQVLENCYFCDDSMQPVTAATIWNRIL